MCPRGRGFPFFPFLSFLRLCEVDPLWWHQVLHRYVLYSPQFFFFTFNLNPVFLQQSSWVIQVELAIGPEEGISYLTDKGSTVSFCHKQVVVCEKSCLMNNIRSVFLF